MTTYAFPSIQPSTMTTQLLTNTASFVSPLTGATQTTDRGGERWAISMTFNNLSGDDRATMQAFVTKIRGQANRFTLSMPTENNRGNFGGTPLTQGNYTGQTLTADGCSTSVNTWIAAGDWFEVNGELKMASIGSNSNGSGEVDITFAPRLRVGTGDNSAITTSGAEGTFIMIEDPVWSDIPGGFSSLTIEAIEDIT